MMKILVLLLFFASFSPVIGQASALDRAIEAYKAENYATALVILQRLADGDGRENGLVWNYIGLTNMKIDDLPTAEKAFEKAVRFSPNDSSIRSNYAFVFLLRRDQGGALRNATKAIELDPNNSGAYLIRAFARHWGVKNDEALDDVNRAIALKSDFSSAYLLKSEILLSQFVSKSEGRRQDTGAIRLIDNAVAALEDCASVCKDPATVTERGRKLDDLKSYASFFRLGYPLEPLGSKSAITDITPPRVLSLPSIPYSDLDGFVIRGSVKVIALFDIDGSVKSVFVATPLPVELSQILIRTTRQIRFRPAQREGKAFPVVKLVEFEL